MKKLVSRTAALEKSSLNL